MRLDGLHLLLTYQCTRECDHCFAWGSPWQSGTMTLKQVLHLLDEAEQVGTVEWIYFEGGEPFLYYGTLLQGVRSAAGRGFRVGIVSNAYWATSVDDAVACLEPFRGLVHDLSVSSDLYHSADTSAVEPGFAAEAARHLGIKCDAISIAQPADGTATCPKGMLPAGESQVMSRGRAVDKLASRAPHRPWEEFDECPHEDLREPGRLHVDAFYNLHICQGLCIGNLKENSLREICAEYDPDSHPVIGPILRGGPAGLLRDHRLFHDAGYADACHLCCETRRVLRRKYPESLAPDQMYGVPED